MGSVASFVKCLRVRSALLAYGGETHPWLARLKRIAATGVMYRRGAAKCFCGISIPYGVAAFHGGIASSAARKLGGCGGSSARSARRLAAL